MYLSYSALLKWNQCPFLYKISYVDKIRLFTGNVHTAFGNASHNTIHSILTTNVGDVETTFKNNFKSIIKGLGEEEKRKIVTDFDTKKLYKEMFASGGDLCEKTIKQLYIDFPGFELISSEGQIFEPITGVKDINYDFKGYLDLVIKTPDDIVHVLDFKTCSWGWDQKKRSDTWINYQLVFYKHFLSQQNNIDPEKIKAHFALIKRTAKKDNIEIFEVKIGEKKTKNALKILNNAVYNIDRKFFPKNRLGCSNCDFHKTKWCP